MDFREIVKNSNPPPEIIEEEKYCCKEFIIRTISYSNEDWVITDWGDNISIWPVRFCPFCGKKISEEK